MISCKRATQLISKALDEPLTLKEEFELRLHNFICEFCQKFQDQVQLVRTAFKQKKMDSEDKSFMEPEPTVPPEARERLKKKLREQVK